MADEVLEVGIADQWRRGGRSWALARARLNAVQAQSYPSPVAGRDVVDVGALAEELLEQVIKAMHGASALVESTSYSRSTSEPFSPDPRGVEHEFTLATHGEKRKNRASHGGAVR